jgi:hypothetical protein
VEITGSSEDQLAKAEARGLRRPLDSLPRVRPISCLSSFVLWVGTAVVVSFAVIVIVLVILLARRDWDLLGRAAISVELLALSDQQCDGLILPFVWAADKVTSTKRPSALSEPALALARILL